MKYIDTFIKRLKTGGYKVCIWGQADDHVMDWNGCNYRTRTVGAEPPSHLQYQPKLGFATVEEALAWARVRFPDGDRGAREYAANAGDGTHLPPRDDLRDWVLERLFDADGPRSF